MDIVKSIPKPLLNILMKQLKSAFTDGGITMITIDLDAEKNLDFKTYETPVVVIAADELQELKDTVNNLL